MKEKILATSYYRDNKKIFKRVTMIIIFAAIILPIILFVLSFIGHCIDYNNHEHDKSCWSFSCDHKWNDRIYRTDYHTKLCEEEFNPIGECSLRFYESAFDYATRPSFLVGGIMLCILFICGGVVSIGIVWIVYWLTHAYTLEITDKRIRGKVWSKQRLDLPVDSISAVAMKGKSSLIVATSSGRISFKYLKNRDELHKCISKLIIQRQEQQHQNGTVQKSSTADNGSNLHQLKELKELLDAGIITEEEFTQKKKQILDL